MNLLQTYLKKSAKVIGYHWDLGTALGSQYLRNEEGAKTVARMNLKYFLLIPTLAVSTYLSGQHLPERVAVRAGISTTNTSFETNFTKEFSESPLTAVLRGQSFLNWYEQNQHQYFLGLGKTFHQKKTKKLFGKPVISQATASLGLQFVNDEYSNKTSLASRIEYACITKRFAGQLRVQASSAFHDNHRLLFSAHVQQYLTSNFSVWASGGIEEIFTSEEHFKNYFLQTGIEWKYVELYLSSNQNVPLGAGIRFTLKPRMKGSKEEYRRFL